jgi:hypothetical protein
MTVSFRLAALSLVAALAACTTPLVATPPGPPSQAALDALSQVRQAYLAGKYGDVIRGVATSDALAEAPAQVRVEALKLQAFSYCVTGYQVLCAEDFTRILQIDPGFELAPAEIGHPLWGPAFRQAKAAQAR